MKYDEVLSSIAWKAKTDNVLLPQKVFVGELGRYLDSGVFKKTNAFLSEVMCPGGCGELAVVVKRFGGYFATCGHTNGPMVDYEILPDEVELYALDRVLFEKLCATGEIDFHYPSTPEERRVDTIKAKEFLQDTARNIAEKRVIKRPAKIAEYILSRAKSGDMFFADCKEIRELKRIHKWQTSSFNTYVRQAFADKSQTKTARRKSKIEANRKMVSKDLQEL